MKNSTLTTYSLRLKTVSDKESYDGQYAALCGHCFYRFEPEFCNRGKGNVENKVGYTRRNWLIPYREISNFEQLTRKLYKKAMEDLNRTHYAKGVPIAELWEEEKKALLPLPTVPFEAMEIEAARVGKYGKITCQSEVYNIPSARIGDTVLLKLWWDRVEILDRNQHCLGTFPREYTMKTKPIDWRGYFGIFIKKPRGAKHATMYRFLPEPVRNYLEQENPSETSRYF